jgi:hypothetical protein
MALPAKQRNKLRRTVALKILVQVFRKGNLSSEQLQFFHRHPVPVG